MDGDKVQELQDDLNTYKQQKDKEVKDLTTKVLALEKILKTHGHEGESNDGTKRLEREIDLLPGNSVGVADVSAMTGFDDRAGNRTVIVLGTGRDTNAADGLNNSQIYMEHQYNTDGSTNQTFFQGIRAPIYIGLTGSMVSGTAVFNQADYQWDVNSLAGAYLTVNSADGSTFAGYQITSNTASYLTITGGTFSFSGNKLAYNISIPIYLGSASFPWRRVYTGDGTAGGIRFGFGATNAGQNGLLYADSAGALQYRNYAGTTTALAAAALVQANIYAGSGAPSLSAPKGSLYVNTTATTTTTRLYINTNGTTGWTNFTSAA